MQPAAGVTAVEVSGEERWAAPELGGVVVVHGGDAGRGAHPLLRQRLLRLLGPPCKARRVSNPEMLLLLLACCSSRGWQRAHGEAVRDASCDAANAAWAPIC